MTAALNSETRRVPMLDVRASAVPETFDAEARTVTFIASTGARGLRRRYWSEDYYEELEISESAIRMDRLNNGAPFLNSHSTWDVGDVIGVVQRGWIEDGKLMVTVQLSQREDVASIIQDIADGVLRHVSVGYNVWEYEVTDKMGELDVYRATDWEPAEVSLVPIAFDDAAVSRSGADRISQAKITNRAAVPTPQGETVMSTETEAGTAAAKVTQGKDNEGMVPEAEVQRRIDAALAEQRSAQEGGDEAARKDERKRFSDIRAAVSNAKLDRDFADELYREGVSIDEARARIIDKLADEEPGQSTSSIRTGVDSGVVANLREAVVSSLVHRKDPTQPLAEGADQFAGMSLLRLSEALLVAEGVNVRGMNRRELATRAMTTSDLPNIAGSMMNRSLLDGYESTPRTFVGVFRQAAMSDFRPVHRIRMSEAPMLEEVKENGEFKYGKLTDEKETYSLATYGKILTFTRQMIINDDLDALTRIPRLFGAAAADLESDLVWAILTANDPLSDNTELFHADRGNLAGSGSAISVASVGAGREAMRGQTGLQGRLINVMPRHIIVGAAKETELDQFLTTITPNVQSNAQPSTLRSLNPVVEPRLAGNGWYLAADYNRVDTIEYAYLEGEQGVYLDTEMGFDVDGIKTKARHDFAAKAIDGVGLYKDPGA